MASKNKTQATEVSVEDYLATVPDESRRKDCQALSDLMARVVGESPKMWGPSIVGFGSYHYRYESGSEGDSCLVGFSSRASEIAIYLVGEHPGREELLARLGKHKTGKGCLYLKRLDDVDLPVLEQLIARSVEQRKINHAC